MSDSQFWTPEEMARELQVTTEYLSQLRSRGGGPPYVKIGRTIRYPKFLIAQWCKETSHQKARNMQVF